MNRFTKWIVNKLGGIDPADVKPREITLTKTEYTHKQVCVTISTPKDDMYMPLYDEWEKDRAAYGIGYEIINSGLFNRSELYDAVSNTMIIKYNARVLEMKKNRGFEQWRD